MNTKILLCNIPLRPKADTFPPVACTSLCNVLIRAGYNPLFYNIDVERPSPEKLSEFFKVEQFDIVGISAVCSTGYRYTKDLANLIKKFSPQTQIILGGNLAAAYEVILRKCQVDVCVIGEGEKVLLSLVKYWRKYGHFKPSKQELYEIKGIAFLDYEGVCRFTGQEKIIDNDEIEQPDYELLDKFSDIDYYITNPRGKYDLVCDARFYETQRQGKKLATIFTSKGCVNRCAFCHRWIKGYRIIPVEKVMTTFRHLINKYNVGFFRISVECFGENKQWLEEFMELIKPLDVLFIIGGARVSIVKKDPTIIRRLREAGLTAIYFGMESGSDKILKIMEKNATPAENLKAAKICADAGVYTIVQLVIGMPGENEQTINETIEFAKKAIDNLSYFALVSINYLQALPGTACYEFLRYHGFLGKTIEDEEGYLLNVSDVNASDFKQYINVSEEPLAKVKLWRMKIGLLVRIHWLKQHRWKFPVALSNRNKYCQNKNVQRNIVSRIKSFLRFKTTTYRAIDLMGESFWKILLFGNRYSLYGIKKAFLITFGLIREEDRSPFKIEGKPLRKILQSKI